MMKNQYLSMKYKTKPWMTPYEGRRQSSTGTRVSGGRFSPYSPKGGFADPVFQGVREAGRRYFNYDPIDYYEKRLFDTDPDSVRWRYDLNKHLIGRDYHKSGRYVPSWLPRFPKKKYTSPSEAYLQKGTKFRQRELQFGVYQRPVVSRRGWGNFESNYEHRWQCSNRCHCKILRGTVRCTQFCRNAMFRKLYATVYKKYPSFHRS